MIIFVNLTESELQNLYVVIHILNFILWGKRSFIGTLTHVPKNIITFLIVPHENENPMATLLLYALGTKPMIRISESGGADEILFLWWNVCLRECNKCEIQTTILYGEDKFTRILGYRANVAYIIRSSKEG